MKVNPKEMVNRDSVTTPTKVKTIPMIKSVTKTRYFLFSERYPVGSEVKDDRDTGVGSIILCCRSILLLLLLMEAGDEDEYR